VIDHINGIKTDNRIENLRNVSQRCNIENVLKPRKHNKSKVLGVRKSKYGFYSSLAHDKKTIYLGHYKTAEEAHNVYLEAKRQLHEGCTI
jgi:calcineurin-like phosphoesterase family protein